MKNRIVRVFKMLSFLLISLVVFSSVYAQNVSLKDVKISDKNIEIEDPVISGNEITNMINFNQVGDFVTFEITIQNNDSYDYTISNIEDNNKNKNISLSYIYSKTDIKKNSEYKFKVTVLYKNRLENVEEINLKDTKITINLVREDGKESSIVINPTTGDSILKYFLLLMIVLVGVVLKQKKKIFYKVLFIIPILFLPFVIFANENFKQEVVFKDIKVKGVMLPYEVTIKVPGQEPIVRTITYGDEIGELPEVDVDGYDFNGWEDSKGNPVDEHTKVTGEIEIRPKLTPKVYTITYDLQGGTATGNKETYTVETDTFTLVNPSKSGYSFSGWTGSNGEALQTEVTVYKGTTGNLSYKAHYRQTENLEYKVIHRKQKLTLDGYDIEEEQIGHGSADTTVRPQTREYEGFISPEEQDLLITDDGLASLTYDYNRIIYSYVVNENTNSTLPSGDYPYGTEATITANPVPGYTFLEWSDGETSNPRNIIISEGTTNITPVYKANEDTAYTVIHYQMDIDGVHYTEYERENKTGTTGEEVTPLPKTYEGFTSPSPKTGVIAGDGSTVIEYQYRRNDITIIINIPGEEPIEKTVKYDDVIGELPTPSKDGYTFDGYEDGDGNPVDENTKVHGEMTITPVFSAIEYTISYDLNGGLNHSENPDKYTIESNNITLKDASRSGYTFIGWTGSNGTTPQKNVVIEKGTTGNKNYKANFSKSADTLDITLDVVSYPYDGNPKTPEVTIKDGDVVLVEGRDYTVEYSDNVNAGEATVTITMTGSVNPDTGASYEGEKEVHFEITAVPPLVELINTSKEYTGEPIVFTEEDVRITPASGGEISFKYCTDETCEHEVSSIEEAGTYYVIAHVSANGNYSESDSEPTIITIERKEIEIPEVTTTFTYTSVEQELLSDTEYYTVSNNIAKNAGTYDVIVTPTSNYKWSDGTVTPKVVTVTINPYDINNESVVPVEEYTYDGEEKKPTPSVIVPIPSSVDTTTLTSSDLDYTYENNINAGEAEVIITGKGNYTGTITKTFEIEKADGSIELSRTSDNIIYGTDSISVDVLNSTGEIEANTTTSGVQVSVNGNSVTITGLANIDSGSEVEVIIKAKTSTNYKEAEETYSITVSDAAITGGSVTITGINGVGETLTASVEDTTPKATYTYEWYRNNEDSMTGGTKIDGETNNTYTLTNNDIGKYIYVVVTASKQNYTQISFKDKVDAENNKTDKAKIEVEIPVSTNTCKNLTYNGNSQILTNESGDGYAYINNSGVNAGEYTVEARLEENYMWSDYTFNNKPITCVINKKNITIKADNQTKVYDSNPLVSDTTCTDKNSELISGHLPVCTSSGSITNVGEETKVLDAVLIKQNETDLTNNYNITKENGTLAITKRDTTCTSSSNTKVYDGIPLTDNTGTCTNLVPNQTVLFNNTGSVTNVSDTSEGNNILESVAIYGQDSSNVTTNYNITKHNGTLTITRANSTCEITNNPILYYPGDNTSSITYICTGDGELNVTSSSNVITVSNKTDTSSTLTSTNTGTATITVSKAEGPNYNSTSVTQNIEVVASTYTVIFDKNDENATGEMSNQVITYGVPTNLAKNNYSYSDHNFVEWNTKADGTGTSYSDETEVTNILEEGTVTLYAQWSYTLIYDFYQNNDMRSWNYIGKNRFNISYDSNSQMNNVIVDGVSGTWENVYMPVNTVSGEKYVLEFDYQNPNGYNNYSSYPGIGMQVLTAVSNSNNVSNQVTVSYLPKEANLNIQHIVVEFTAVSSITYLDFNFGFAQDGETTNVYLGNFKFTKYLEKQYTINTIPTFIFEEGISNTYYTDKISGEELLPNTSINKDTTYYLMISRNKYKVLFNNNTGTGTMESYNAEYGISFQLPSNTFTKTDYTFVGWNTKEDGTGTSYLDKATVKNLTSVNNAEVTLYAQWIVSAAMFDTGTNVNNKMKSLAENDLNNITSVEKSTVKPDISSMTSNNMVSISNSTYVTPIYMWYDNGVINWWTEVDSPELNYNASHMFDGLTNATDINLDGVDGTLSTTMAYMFQNCNSLTELNLSSFDTSNVTTMKGMFNVCGSLQELDLSNFRGNALTTTAYMFQNCSSLTDIDLTNFNMDKVTTMTSMFRNCSNLTEVDLSSALGGSVEDLTYMFYRCSELTTVNINNFDMSEVKNIGIELYVGNSMLGGETTPKLTTVIANNTKYNNVSIRIFTPIISSDTANEPKTSLTTISLRNASVGSATNLHRMFRGLTNLENLDLTNFDTTNVTIMSEMFMECTKLSTLDLSSFDTDKVTTMAYMYSDCNSLTNINLNSFNTEKVTNMSYMFNGCSGIPILNVRMFNTSSVTTMAYMFQNCSSFTELNLSSFDTSNVTTMKGMFNGCGSLQELDLSNFRGNALTTTAYMFQNCSSLTDIDLTNFNMDKVTTMTSMFRNCSNLTEVDLSSALGGSVEDLTYMFYRCSELTTVNINNFDMSEVKNIGIELYVGNSMLGGETTPKLTTVIANNTKYNNVSIRIFTPIISSDTANEPKTSLTTISLRNASVGSATNLHRMFRGLTNLENLDLTNFDTTGVTDMSSMFNGCTSLTTLDLTSFDTTSVTDMSSMFNGCTSLTTIYATNSFDTSSVTSSTNMFKGDTKLVGGLGTVFSSSYIDKTRAHLDGGSSNPGYFSAGTGWRFVNSQTSQSLLDQEWSYFIDGERVESGWHWYPDLYGELQKYYFVDGKAHLGWLEYEGDYYYLSTDDDDNNGYVNCDAYRNISKVINGKSYAFDSDGKCLNYDGPDMYTIIFDANGGTTSESYRNLGPDEALGILPTATREGYVFGGWWTSKTGGTEVNSETVPNSGGTYYAKWYKINTVSFDSTEGEFSTDVTTNTIIYSNTYMDGTTYKEPYRSGYVLVGWNTESDGTGTSYLDEQEVLTNIDSLNNETLYAQWIVAQAMFDTGQNVNAKIKRLAGNASATYDSSDNNITSIQKSTTKPDISTMTSDNIVSISDTTYNAPIYMWFDNGTIYWWSEDSNLSLNQDSSYMFARCSSLTSLDLNNFDTSNVTNMAGMFAVSSSLTSLNLGNKFDTSNVIDMSGMFAGCSILTSIDLADKFDTSNVTNMAGMFSGCSILTSIDLGDKFDTSNVTIMEAMFWNCISITSIDLGNKFDTSNVINMAGMFASCSSLTSIDLGDKFDTCNVIRMPSMFASCSSLTELDLSGFNTSNVIEISAMFADCSSLTTIYATSTFVTTSVTSSGSMFTGDTKLVGGMGTVFDSLYDDAAYARIDGGTSNPGYFTDKSSITIKFDANGGTGTMSDQTVQYNVATPLNTNTFTKSGYVFVGWNTKTYGTGTAYADGANIQAKSLTTLYAQWIEAHAMFDTGQNVNAKMKKLAGNASARYSSSDTNITSIQKSTSKPDISSMISDNIVSISNTTYNTPIYMWFDNGIIYWWSEDGNPSLNQNSSYMFYNLKGLTNINLTPFDTSNVTNMSDMFRSCSSLTTLDLGDKFDTSKVTNMGSMFSSCSSLTSLDLGDKFDTSSVTGMANMFYECSSLTSLDLGDKFDTSNVTTMHQMFVRCSSLTSLDLGDKFDTSNVTTMQSMFSLCGNLTTIYATNAFVTTAVTSSSSMFFNDKKLVGGMGTTYSSSHQDAIYAHIDGGTSNPGYFTDKSSISIKFNANGGEGTMSDQIVQYNVSTPLNPNTFTKTGYILVGWNTKADGTGTPYSDGDSIQVKSVTILYAQWIEAHAMFDTGTNVNVKMKKLAGNTAATSNTLSHDITSIQKSTVKPNISTMTSNNIVSTAINPTSLTSNTLIYMWFDNGTIYWWSEDNNPSLNQDSSSLFDSLILLNEIDLSSFDTSNVTNMERMFYDCGSLTSLNLGDNFDTSNVTNMSKMFDSCSSLTSLNLGDNFDTSNVTNMSSMFDSCSSLTNLNLGDNFDTSNVTLMNSMFSGCNSLTSLDLSSFNTSKVINIDGLFFNCNNLTTLDLSSFDTSKVESMWSMFALCTNLTNINFGNNFDTSKVTSMKSMFAECSSLTILDLSMFDTSSLTTMENMFYNCTSLTTLDLSSFNTSKVSGFYVAFADCTSLTTIYASNQFVTTSATDSNRMFIGDVNLIGGEGTVYDSSHTDAAYAHIDGGTSNPGYFTDKSSITIKFDANGGTGTMSDQIVQYNVSTPLTTNTFTKSGYIFAGWNTKADGTGTPYADGANIQVKSLTTLYAQWNRVMAENLSYDNTNTGIPCSDAQCAIDYISSMLDGNSTSNGNSTGASISKFIDRFRQFNKKSGRVVLGVFISIVLILGTVLLIIRSNKKKIRNN